MSALIGVSPLLLLVAAGLSIMVIDAFAEDRTELALVTFLSLPLLFWITMIFRSRIRRACSRGPQDDGSREG